MAKTEIEHLARIEDLLTAITKKTLADTLNKELTDKKTRELYERTGSGSVAALAKRVGFSTGKVSGLWQKWEQAGLLIKDGAHYRKIF